jgi:hypothetical protein
MINRGKKFSTVLFQCKTRKRLKRGGGGGCGFFLVTF